MLTVYHSTMISFMIAISLFAVLSTTTTKMVYVTGFATVPLTTRTTTTVATATTKTTLEATPFLFGFLNKKDDTDDNDKSAVVNKNKKAPATTTKKNTAVNNKAKSSKESSGSVKNTNTYNSRSK